MWKQLLEMGEAQVGKLAGQLLANEAFMSGVQTAVAKALEAKGVVDRQLSLALRALQVPTRDELQRLNERLDEIERIFEGLTQKVEAVNAAASTPDTSATARPSSEVHDQT